MAVSQAGEVGPVFKVEEVVGRAIVREQGAGAPKSLSAKTELSPKAEALVTSPDARVQLRDAGGALWRIGSLAVWMPRTDGARVLSGTVLVNVPSGQTRVVEAVGGSARLGQGMWITQAVENDGLKLVCLDGPARVEAVNAAGAGQPDGGLRDLRPGDVVFLRPGGTEFGPVVVIFLREMLMTSRLINGFESRLPRLRRLQANAYVQGERLKRVTTAFVGGARDDGGFQLVVPKRSETPVDDAQPR